MYIICALLAIGLSGFYSGTETGLYCLNRLRLRVDADKGQTNAKKLSRVVDNSHNALSTLLVGTNVANYLATIFVALILTGTLNIDAGTSEIYTTLIVTPIVFVFGEVVPKILFQRNADLLMRRGATLFSISAFVFRIPVLFLNLVSNPIMAIVIPRGSKQINDPREKIATLLQDAIAEDSSADHIEFIDRVLSLPNIAIHQVMVPRNRTAGIRADAGRKEFISLFRKHGHSRYPVFEKSSRRITGYVEAHTLIADTQWKTVGEYLKPIINIAAHDSASSTIVKLQEAGETIAVVTDRSNQLLGLVTMKDLLEEVTGELHEW